MSDFGDLWDEATRDHESEQRQAALSAAGVDAQGVWPFVAVASSEAEFADRMSLARESIDTIAARHGVSYEDVAGPLARGFQAVRKQATDPGSLGGPSGHKDHANDEIQGDSRPPTDDSNPEWGVPGMGPADGGYGPNPYDGGGYGGGSHTVQPAPGDQQMMGSLDRALSGLRTALVEGQDPLEWVQAQNPPGGPQYALVPSHHDWTQQFSGGNPPAYTQAMDQAGAPGAPEGVGGHSTAPQVTGSRRVTAASLGLAGMQDGEERRYHLPGDEGDPSKHFEVSYHSEPAMGDDGRQAPGFTTGSYMVKHPVHGGGYEFFRHTPHGPGLDGAKPYAARNAEDFVVHNLRQMERVKDPGTHGREAARAHRPF